MTVIHAVNEFGGGGEYTCRRDAAANKVDPVARIPRCNAYRRFEVERTDGKRSNVLNVQRFLKRRNNDLIDRQSWKNDLRKINKH